MRAVDSSPDSFVAIKDLTAILRKFVLQELSTSLSSANYLGISEDRVERCFLEKSL